MVAIRQEDGTAGGHRFQVGGGRDTARERFQGPAPAEHPIAGSESAGVFGDDAEVFGAAARAGEIAAEAVEAATNGMDVRVAKRRDGQPSLQVDHVRPGARHGACIGGSGHRGDPPVRHDDRIAARARAVRGPQPSIHQYQRSRHPAPSLPGPPGPECVQDKVIERRGRARPGDPGCRGHNEPPRGTERPSQAGQQGARRLSAGAGDRRARNQQRHPHAQRTAGSGGRTRRRGPRRSAPQAHPPSRRAATSARPRAGPPPRGRDWARWGSSPVCRRRGPGKREEESQVPHEGGDRQVKLTFVRPLYASGHKRGQKRARLRFGVPGHVGDGPRTAG